MQKSFQRALLALSLTLPTALAAQTAPAAAPEAASPAAPAPATPEPAAPAPATPEPAAPAPATPAPAAPAPAAAAPAVEKLTGLAAWSALIGNTVIGKSADGDPLVEYYAADGKVKQLLDDELSTGKWSVRGQMVCFEFPEDDDESCFLVEVTGAIATFLEKEGSGRRYEILRGNAKGL